ncbi:MAG TPA: alpha/beta hydrolase [Actinomycetota bacterium]|nr:alpha/beta hydrolase [Actinomycetota bacterium]
MTVEPETRYAKTEEGYVGYQVFGQGPIDVLFISNWVGNIEVMWEHPSMVRFLNRLGGFARVILFDKRGSGVSDPVPLGALPTLEHWTDDARVVMDAAGSERPALIGDAEGGPMAMVFGATCPERTRALVLVNTFARILRADDYPIGMPPDAAEKLLRLWEPAWGTGAVLKLTAPSVAADPAMQRWASKHMRLAAPKLASTRMYRWVLNIDVRSVLPSIHAPTLVVHRAGNRLYRAPMGRYLTDHIPGARMSSFRGLTGIRPPRTRDRSWTRSRSS